MMNEKMNMLQKRFYDIWSGKNPWRDSKGNEIKDFVLKAEENLPIYKLLKKHYKGDTVQMNRYFTTKKRMKVFTWNGDKDTTFSSVDSIKYYTRILNTGMMTIEPTTGYIKDWVGGIDYKHFNYDHVNQAKRQAGSTFKPFAYVTALDNGFTHVEADVFLRKGKLIVAHFLPMLSHHHTLEKLYLKPLQAHLNDTNNTAPMMLMIDIKSDSELTPGLDHIAGKISRGNIRD